MLQHARYWFPNQESTLRPAALEVQRSNQPLNRQEIPQIELSRGIFYGVFLKPNKHSVIHKLYNFCIEKINENSTGAPAVRINAFSFEAGFNLWLRN